MASCRLADRGTLTNWGQYEICTDPWLSRSIRLDCQLYAAGVENHSIARDQGYIAGNVLANRVWFRFMACIRRALGPVAASSVERCLPRAVGVYSCHEITAPLEEECRRGGD